MLGKLQHKWLTLLCGIMLLMAGVGNARAERVAIFPLEDLSRGVSGYNTVVSKHLAAEIATTGMEVIDGQPVMDFLVRNRLRWLGYLESYHVLRAKEELGADYLLIGTIIQQQEGATSARIGLTLQLLRTSDARVVWSDSGGISTADNQRLLGLAEPRTIEELLPLLSRDILSTWPEKFDFAEMSVANMDIESVVLEPKFVKPGEKVKVSVRLRSFEKSEERPQVFVQTGSSVYLANETPYLRNYELEHANFVYRESKAKGTLYREAKSSDTLFRVLAPEQVAPRNVAKQQDVPHNEAKQVEVPYNEAKQVEVPYNEAKQVEVPYNEAKQVEVPYNEAKQVEVPYNEAKQVEVPYNEAKQVEVPYNEAKQVEVPYNEAKQVEVPYNEAKQVEVPYNEAKQVEVPYNEAKQVEVPYNEANNADAVTYEATWVGSDDRGGVASTLDPTIRVAALSNDVKILQSLWEGLDQDDRYPVSLVLSYPSGLQQTAFLGYYHVDSKAPPVALEMKGHKIDGLSTFRDQIVIVPRLLQAEPISKWRITVINEKGETVVDQSGEDSLPPSLYWRGKGSDGVSLPDGVYEVVLQVWDRARNEATAREKVAFRPSPPEMVLNVKNSEENITIDLAQKGFVPVDFWRLELRYQNGKFYKFVEGNEFPAQVEIPLPVDPENRKLECSVLFKNILGGKTSSRIPDLVAYSAKAAVQEAEKAKGDQPAVDEWVSEF